MVGWLSTVPRGKLLLDFGALGHWDAGKSGQQAQVSFPDARPVRGARPPGEGCACLVKTPGYLVKMIAPSVSSSRLRCSEKAVS